MTTYNKASPYAKTAYWGNALDIADIPHIPAAETDVLYQIDSIYENRPDLLAYDLYGDSALWWIFAVRNPGIIKDPIFDFVPGTIIYVPKKESVISALGL